MSRIDSRLAGKHKRREALMFFYIPSPATGGFIPTTRSGPTKAKAVSGFNSPETALNFLFKFNFLIYRISAA